MSASSRNFLAWINCTNFLVLANVVIFFVMIFSSGARILRAAPQETLLNWGANLGALTSFGEYWRLFTCMFVHASILHLIFNMWALYTLGPTVSAIYGNLRFLAIYLMSGFAGALASSAWNPTQTSAGSSGAIFGIAGALLSVYILHGPEADKARAFGHPIAFAAMIAASIFYGLFNPDIDNAAHIGGVMGGILCGLFLQPGNENNKQLRQAMQLAALLTMMIFTSIICVSAARIDKRSTTFRIAVAAMANLRANNFEKALQGYDILVKDEPSSTYLVGRAAALTGLKQYMRALADCELACSLDPKDPNAHLARARVNHELGNEKDAIKDLSKVINEFPNKSPAFNSRAWSEIAVGDYKQAVEDASQAIKLDADDSESLDTRGLAFYHLQEFDKALADFQHGLDLDPKNGACHYHRSLVYKQQGKPDEAEQELQASKTLGYVPESWESKLN